MSNIISRAMQEDLERRVNAAVSISEWQAAIHRNATIHGFYDDIVACIANASRDSTDAIKRDFVLAQLAKTMGEGGEAVHAIQHNGVESTELAEELADIVIRVLDLSQYLGFDMESTVKAKMLKNIYRPYKHGKIC